MTLIRSVAASWSLALQLCPALLLLACQAAAPSVEPPASGRAGGTGGAPSSTGTGGQGGVASPGTGGASPDAAATPGVDGGGAVAQDVRPAPRDADAPDARDAVPEATGPVASSELDRRCTVPVTFSNPAAGTEGAMFFAASIPDAVATMQAHSRAICRILYRKPEEVRNVQQQRLILEANSDIAYTAGAAITFSTNYIAGFARGKAKAAIDAELNGVLVHEGAHVWQYTNGGGALVEAMADYVRFKAGFYTLARRRAGGNWDQPYTTGGFFIAWVEEKYDPDYGYKLNLGMKDRGFNYPAFVQQLTGKPIAAVWSEYQAAIR